MEQAFPGGVRLNGHKFEVVMAPRLDSLNCLNLCNFNQHDLQLNHRIFAGFGPHVWLRCTNEEFLTIASPGRHEDLLPFACGKYGEVVMIWGKSACDEGTHTREIESLSLDVRTCNDGVTFLFTGRTGAATHVLEPDRLLGDGPVQFEAWFEVPRLLIPVFAPDEKLRCALDRKIFSGTANSG